jgi:DNA-binding Lrp family transcriptional regulator
MSIDPLLQLLRRQARYSHKELAEVLSLSESQVAERLAAWESNGTILGYQAVINP